MVSPLPVEGHESEAERRIREAALAGSVSLDLKGLSLSQVPDSITQLSQLWELSLGNNNLVALPETLGQLTSLRRLNVVRNRITALPESLTRLQCLEELFVSNNPLRTLPEWLEHLSQLRLLWASECKIDVLPECIGKLRALERLYLYGNRLSALPDALGQLSRLRKVVLFRNQLVGLPGSLQNLEKLTELYLHGNPELGIPVEVLGPSWNEVRTQASTPANPQAILEYYFRTRNRQRPLNEAKLILVGRGGTGKTCLVKRLLRNTFNPLEAETTGVDIQPWRVTLPDGDSMRLHMWDFGGQRILHGTHHFFFTERTLYLLVLSGREGMASDDAEYWLQLIKSFGGDSRVIVSLNKCKEHWFDVNRGLLLEKYPFIVDFIHTDSKDRIGIDQLQTIILEAIQNLESRKVGFPAEWFAIKEKLVNMRENFITWEEFRKLCEAHNEPNEEAQHNLANYLHVLGVALHYGDDSRLRDTRILNPNWITDAIYTLLRVGHRDRTCGVLATSDLAWALDPQHYPKASHDFLLRLMEKFHLCFRIPACEESYLVPELLDENQPDVGPLLRQKGIDFRYQFQAYPEGLLPRFIVRTQLLSEPNSQWRWRSGVVLERDGCHAVVRADPHGRRIDIHVVGPVDARMRSLLAIVRVCFEELLSGMKGLAVDERVPIPGRPNFTVSYADLLKREGRGETTFYPEGSDDPVSVQQLLNGIEPPENRAQRRSGCDLVLRTVVELDLVGYSDIAAKMEAEATATVVLSFNDRIQGFVDAGLAATDVRRDDAVMATTGDGAILVFRGAELAHRFSMAVHEICRIHNEGKSIEAEKRRFRIGVATGTLAMDNLVGFPRVAGMVIARAVRLEAAANSGEVVIDSDTFENLPPEIRLKYGPEEVVHGKREERIRSHRLTVIVN